MHLGSPPSGPSEDGQDHLPPWLGWDDAWAAALAAAVAEPAVRMLAELAGRAPVVARVTRQDRSGALAETASGPIQVTWGADLVAAGSGATAGDMVVLQPWGDGRVTLEAVLPRRTAVSRASASGRSTAQVLAANIDAVAVVEALVPEPQVGRMERLLALAWDSGATPYLVLTKGDLCADGPALAAELGAQVAPGVAVHVTAAATGDGLEAVADLCRDGHTLALVGGSGAGKSTLLNALVGADVMATRALAAVGKGRHTTVTRELHATPYGGSVVDTPGLRGVGLLDAGGLAEVFAEVEELARDCRFRDCAHESEPGCAVLAAVEAGELPERRLLSWRKLGREAEWAASRTDARLRKARQQGWAAIERSVRASGVIRP